MTQRDLFHKLLQELCNAINFTFYFIYVFHCILNLTQVGTGTCNKKLRDLQKKAQTKAFYV